MDEEKRSKILRRAVSVYGDLPQTDILIEEMSELIKAIIKSRRHGGNYETHELMEEMVDVQICLDQLRMIIERNRNQSILATLDLIAERKLTRLEGRMDNRELYAKARLE